MFNASLLKSENFLSFLPVFNGLHNVLTSAIVFDLESETANILFAPGYPAKIYEKAICSSEVIKRIISSFEIKSQESVKNFLDFSQIKTWPENTTFRHEDFYSKKDGWLRINLVIADCSKKSHVSKIFFSTQDINEKKQIELNNLRREKKLEKTKAQLFINLVKMLYGFSATVNLNSWEYTIIFGASRNPVFNLMKQSKDYIVTFNRVKQIVLPQYQILLENFLGLSALSKLKRKRGFIGSITIGSTRGKKIRYQEVNLFINENPAGEPEANIFGRDITKMHLQQERLKRELRASFSKDILISQVLKMVYTFKMTVNTKNLYCNLEAGRSFRPIYNSIDQNKQYEQLYRKFIVMIKPENYNEFEKLLSPERIKSYSNSYGYIGSLEFSFELNHKIRWEEINVFALTDANDNTIINLLGREVSETHNKANLEAQLKIAQASNQAKSKFLSNMSHDIRTPINGIMGMLKIAERYKNDRNRLEDCLKKIDTSANHLLTLINDVLDLNRLESGQMVLDKDSFSIPNIVNDIDLIVRPMAEESSIYLITRNINTVSPNVFGSSLHIRQIMLNVLSNAIKYNHDHGHVYFTVTQLKKTKDEVSYCFEIKDEGIGMTKEFQKRMFNSFEQENIQDVTVRSECKGYGLGLSIVKGLVNQMHGTIYVESEKNKGTTFRICLSFKIDHETKSSTQKTIPSISSDSIKGVKILLVEDNSLNMEIAKVLLEAEGAVVTPATDGQDAINVFENHEPETFDIILMDIMMPVVNGIEATRIIRSLDREDARTIPILAMTANAFSEDIKKCLEAGMDEHISKPFQIEKLKTTISKYTNASVTLKQTT